MDITGERELRIRMHLLLTRKAKLGLAQPTGECLNGWTGGGVRDLTSSYHTKNSLSLETRDNKLTHSTGYAENCQKVLCLQWSYRRYVGTSMFNIIKDPQMYFQMTMYLNHVMTENEKYVNVLKWWKMATNWINQSTLGLYVKDISSHKFLSKLALRDILLLPLCYRIFPIFCTFFPREAISVTFKLPYAIIHIVNNNT